MSNPPLEVFRRWDEWKSFRPGLERMTRALAALDFPHRFYRHVTVGGTNGKGTLSLNLMQQLPGRVGMFCSPHLVDMRERITIDGRFVPDHVWRQAYDHVLEKVRRDDTSYFEMMLLTAVVIFKMEAVDWVVFEVGLGGRWDAVNALSAEVMLLTNVSLDHTALLGDTVEAIALEKIEIARVDKPFIVPASVAAIPAVNDRLRQIGPKQVLFEDAGVIEDNLRCYNAATAFLPIQPLATLSLPLGRKMKCGPGLFVDSSHNMASWQSTLVWIRSQVTEPIRVLCNLSQGRCATTFVSLFKDIARDIVVLPAEYEKAHTGSWPGGVRHASWDELPAMLEQPVLVTGSSYFVGDFLKRYRAFAPSNTE